MRLEPRAKGVVIVASFVPLLAFDDLPSEGAEFALVMIRRTEDGELVVVGEVPQDVPLLERAARKLIG